MRQSNPAEVVIGPTTWNSIGDLDRLQLPRRDRHLIVTVHYYNPFQFTHQAQSWVGPQSQHWLGTRWTGSSAERKAVTSDFDKAIAWAVAHGRPIYLGESRRLQPGGHGVARPLDAVRGPCRLGAEDGLRLWEFCSGFGAYDPKRDTWIAPLEGCWSEAIRRNESSLGPVS